MMNGKPQKWFGMNWITKHKRLAIYLRDDFLCTYCGRQLRNCGQGEISLDHLTPRSEGGDNHESNLVTVCSKCNSARCNKSVKEFASKEARERIYKIRRRKLNIPLAKSLINGRTGGDSEGER